MMGLCLWEWVRMGLRVRGMCMMCVRVVGV